VGDTVRERLAAGGVLKQLIDAQLTPEAIIDHLLIRVLSRRPTSDEAKSLRELVGDAVQDQSVYEDIFWSLLNSTEFAFNH
jgi:hypothetical protein